MSKKYYTDYVRHALRFYTRNCNKPEFKTDVDKANWIACDRVIRKYSDDHAQLLISIYSGYDTLADEVYNASKKFGVNQDVIWDDMKEFERKIAKARLLL